MIEIAAKLADTFRHKRTPRSLLNTHMLQEKIWARPDYIMYSDMYTSHVFKHQRVKSDVTTIMNTMAFNVHVHHLVYTKIQVQIPRHKYFLNVAQQNVTQVFDNVSLLTTFTQIFLHINDLKIILPKLPQVKAFALYLYAIVNVLTS